MDFAQQQEVYYLIIIWLLIATLLMYLFSRTPIGRITNAVRDNEERAEFLGYSQRHVRWMSFCASGFFCGIAGALWAINLEILTEENLNTTQSGIILLVTFLGGVGFFVGPIVGAIVFTLLQTVLSLYTEIWQLYLGILFVATVMFFPSGLTGLLAIHIQPWKLGKIGMLAKPYAMIAVPVLLFILSAAAFMEVLFHVRHSSAAAGEMSLFGLTFNSHSILPWVVILAVLAISFYCIRKIVPSLKDAWDEANHLEAAE